MGASANEGTHVKSWMECSPTMLGNNGGGSGGRESSFVECWFSSSHSHSSWMIVHVGCATPTPLVGLFLFHNNWRVQNGWTQDNIIRGEQSGAKMEVVENNAYEGSKDSQPNIHENRVDCRWESVKDEHVCGHDPQHHWVVVELLNEMEANSQLR